MNKQDEMIKQLELLRSKSIPSEPIPYTIFQQRYIEISNTIAEQIDPSLFVIRGDGTPIIRGLGENKKWAKNREKILNQFELIDANDYQEEIKEGVIYLYRESDGDKTGYILTCIKLNDNGLSRYFVMNANLGLENITNISWLSSGYDGWYGYPTLRECMLNWMGTGSISILEGYDLAEPITRTLNFSRGGFL